MGKKGPLLIVYEEHEELLTQKSLSNQAAFCWSSRQIHTDQLKHEQNLRRGTFCAKVKNLITMELSNLSIRQIYRWLFWVSLCLLRLLRLLTFNFVLHPF